MKQDQKKDDLCEKLLKYLDGNLEKQERLEIEKQLKSDRNARDLLSSIAEQAVLVADAGRVVEARNTISKKEVLSFPNVLFWKWAFGGSAAIILLMITLLFTMKSEEEKSPQFLAKVIHTEGKAKINGAKDITSGDKLFPGDQLTISSGLIELAYIESGVHVLGTAPLNLKMNSSKRVNLLEGQIKLVVPPQGIGFVVKTPEREITDLGTSFVVKASKAGSRVLVLDGQVAVKSEDDSKDQLMIEGDLAKFGRDGQVDWQSHKEHPEISELSPPPFPPNEASLHGEILGFKSSTSTTRLKQKSDVIAKQILPLVQSGFHDRSCLEELTQGNPLRYSGILGSYKTFPTRAGLVPYSEEFGWMAWYHGQVIPPNPGRYRFWGYADNHLLVSISGKPVFEGSRRDSPFKELGIARSDHPSYPCLNAMAGFASGAWFETGQDELQIDIVFGEIMNHETSGILLIEKEGALYKETHWGQPKWSLFLTEPPTEDEFDELVILRKQMEDKLLGSFSIRENACWKVVTPKDL